MAEPIPRQPSRQDGGRPPPKAPPTAPAPATTAWGQPGVESAPLRGFARYLLLPS